MLGGMTRRTNKNDNIKPPISRGKDSDALLVEVETIHKSIMNKQPWLWDKTCSVFLKGKQQGVEGLFEKIEFTPFACNSGLTLACDSGKFSDDVHGFAKSIEVEMKAVLVENKKNEVSGLLEEASVYSKYNFKAISGLEKTDFGPDGFFLSHADMTKWVDNTGIGANAFLRDRSILINAECGSLGKVIDK